MIVANDLRFEVRAIGAPAAFAEQSGATVEEWQALEARSTGTLFQTWRWLDAWSRTAAASFGEEPVTAVGRLPNGRAVAILPLARVRRFGRPVITWLGQPHSNYGQPLIDTAAAGMLRPEMLSDVAVDIARLVGADAVHLAGLPGADRPDRDRSAPARARTMATANDAFVLDLATDFSAQYAGLFSSRTRQQLRRKHRRLGELGPLAIRQARTVDDKLAFLDDFFAQKRAQLALQGVASIFDRPAIRAFYRELARPGASALPALDVTALRVGERTAAVVIAMTHRDRLYMLNTSISADADLSESSPGKLLIHAHVEASHRAGVRQYDLGPGSAAYKTDWRPRTLSLGDLVMPVSLPGRAVAAALATKVGAKRIIKRTPLLWQAAQTARRIAARGLPLGHAVAHDPVATGVPAVSMPHSDHEPS